jgi:hypothetical protein
MFIMERRTLGVFAALGVALSMVVGLNRLPNSADSTEPRSDAVTAMTSRCVCLADDPSLAAVPRCGAFRKTMNSRGSDVGALLGRD